MLELDHIDGDHLNNALCNLRLLCANCHAQTPTYRGRNAKYPNIPSFKEIQLGIARTGSILAYALELSVTPERVRGWLRSDRLRARDAGELSPEHQSVDRRPGGEIG
ncbi:MAG: HNH endonuclease signature motif containing protein [Usitatibacter sp.]